MNFSGKDLNDTYFIKAGLAQANFSKAQLKGVMFNDATLIGANFSKADLSNSSFKRADISATDMRDSILHGANFLQAYFEQGSAELEPKIYRALYDKHTLGLKELKIDKRKMCTDLPCRPAVPEI